MDNCKITKLGKKLAVEFGVNLDRDVVLYAWPKFVSKCNGKQVDTVSLLSGLDLACDTSGAAFLSLVKKYCCKNGIELDLSGFPPNFELLTENCPNVEIREPKTKVYTDFVTGIGKSVVSGISNLRSEVDYLGRVIFAFCEAIIKPASIRIRDLMGIIESSGVNSFGICSAIGFLFGLILSFQSATSMKQFGAEIYVASLVSLTLFRVMGPFVAAVLFAARSGTAFAAEIGTMKINEEIDALKTMGFAPVKFLVLPRVIAGTFFVPLLTIYANLFGILGMSVVMRSMGFPFRVIYDQLTLITTLTDFTGGMFKAIVYGFEVATISCLRGLQTTSGGKAVGDSATRAVVSSVVLVVLTEGVFSVIFYLLGI